MRLGYGVIKRRVDHCDDQADQQKEKIAFCVFMSRIAIPVEGKERQRDDGGRWDCENQWEKNKR